MATFKEKCEQYFDTSNLYEILKVKKDASTKEIKKAYHKLSLLVHPDRVEEGKKLEATEKFKVLSRVHTVLQDPDKRKIYDETGDVGEDDLNDTGFDWMQYWRSMFKPITTQVIENYKSDYIGSDTEKLDIKKAYVNSKGSMDHILEMVMFSDCDSEPRITEIVRGLVDAGEVEEYDAFFKEPKRKKEKRRRKWEEEKKEAESIKIDDKELQMQIQRNHEEREKKFSDMLANLEAKYEKKESKRKSVKHEKTSVSPPRKTRRSTRSTK